MRLKHVLSVMLLGLSPGLLMSAAQSAPEKHAISPDDIVNLLQPGDPQISHDGSRIAYTIGTPQPMGKPPLSRIWQISTRVGSSARELPAPEGASDRSPQWSVGGEQLAFLSDRPASGSAAKPAPGGVQVWQLAAGSDVPVQVSHSGTDVQSFAFSPDRKRLAYLAQDPASAADKARAARQDDAHEVERPQRFSRLWIQELAGGQPRALTPAAMQVHDFNWSPDGRTLALRVSSGTTLNDYWYDSQVLIFDIGTATVMKTLSTRASAHPLQFSPDGRRLLYGELGPHGMTATLYLQPLAGGARVALAPAWGGTLWAARWLDDAALIGQGQRGVRGALLRINAASGAETEIARPRFPYQSFSVASTGAIAFLGSRDDMPPEIWSWDGNTLHELTRSHPQVEQWSRGQVRELNWRSSRDAREIHGVLVTPADWVPGTPLPTLVQIHGGPAWAWWSGWLGSWHDWGQLLASHGYAVLLPNPRGSEGQGRAFTESTRNDWGGADFQDVLDGIDMLEREGVIDPARLAIGGWSYGGYLSAWAVTQSKRFRTAIVGAGITDIGAMALTTDTPDYLPGYFGDPLRNRDRYDAHSPIRQVENVAVPVLILHGEADKRVPVSQGQMFYRALRMRGVPVEMVSYPRGPHWFHEREHQRDLQQRVLDWLDARLLNEPAASQPAPR